MLTKVALPSPQHTRAQIGLVILNYILLSANALAERQKIGLVLGGGGARGAAHVGVLKVIERECASIAELF